jgi:hypothetical protein
MQLWEQVAVLDDEVKRMLDESRMAFIARSESAIRQLRDDELIDGSIDPRHAAFALTGMVSRFAYVWFTRGERFQFEEVVEQLSMLWVNALGLSESDRELPVHRRRLSTQSARK